MSAPLDMNRDIRARWAAALRSGEYPQGKRQLRNESGEFCCLGVLCELAVADEIIPPAAGPDEDGSMRYGADSDYLPAEVVMWAGLSSYNPDVAYDGGSAALSELNDEAGASFDEIAGLIEGSATRTDGRA